MFNMRGVFGPQCGLRLVVKLTWDFLVFFVLGEVPFFFEYQSDLIVLVVLWKVKWSRYTP
jgi:hypothetical protein